MTFFRAVYIDTFGSTLTTCTAYQEKRFNMENIVFEDRRNAGKKLANALVKREFNREPAVVIDIPRSGVEVADEVAKELSAADELICLSILPYFSAVGA